MNYKKLMLVVLVLANLGVMPLFAQIPVDDWDDDMKTKYSLLKDFTKEKNFNEAKPNLDWLVANYPNMHASVYSKGIDVYEGLVKEEQDKTQQNAYEDSVLSMFDKKIQYFGDEAKNMNLKGYSEFSYWGDRPDKYEKMYEDYKKIVELNGNDTYNQNIGYYMFLAL